MKFVNTQQLAFILDIKKEDARAMMCNAWCKAKGIQNMATRNDKGKISDAYPQAMDVQLLADQLNLPTLAESLNDIENNYLSRPASKKWILCDYPEKLEVKANKECKELKLKMPPALESIMRRDLVDKVKQEWRARFPKAIIS